MKRPLASLAAAAALLILAAPAGATIVEALGVTELATRADRIVEGKVLDIRSAWDGPVIVTDVVVGVDRCYKGDCHDEALVVRVLGGAVEDLEQRVDGMARFELDEPVLLFLRGDGTPHALHTLGLEQGKFRLVQAPDGVEAVRADSHVKLIGPHQAEARALGRVKLDVLVALVERSLDPADVPTLDVPPR